jgi:hypothetical protein
LEEFEKLTGVQDNRKQMLVIREATASDAPLNLPTDLGNLRGLKARIWALSGTAEAVPFPKSFMR